MPRVKNYYSSVTEVKQSTAVKPSDLKLSSDAELDCLIQGWLFQIKDLIETYCKKDFTTENVYYPTTGGVQVDKTPSGIHNIALRMGCNMVGQALARIDSPVMRIDEQITGLMTTTVLSNDIKADLDLYKVKIGFPFNKKYTSLVR